MLRAASATANFAAPPAIGNTTPSTGAFTTLSTTGLATLASATVTGAAVVGTVRTGGFTVATLPAGTIGQKTYVTDALAPAFLMAIAAGGAVVTPVFFNGTAWIAG